MRTTGLLVASLAVCLAATACRPIASRAADDARPAATTVASSSDAFSIFELDTTQWTNALAHTAPRAPTHARPIALAMVYTHCIASCPITVATLRRMEQRMPDSLRYILVSLDPARDTDAQLRQWGETFQLSSATWSLWHGADGDVRALAAALGVRYQADANGDIAHSNTIFLLDAHGVLRQRFSGSTDPDALARAARALLP